MADYNIRGINTSAVFPMIQEIANYTLGLKNKQKTLTNGDAITYLNQYMKGSASQENFKKLMQDCDNQINSLLKKLGEFSNRLSEAAKAYKNFDSNTNTFENASNTIKNLKS